MNKFEKAETEYNRNYDPYGEEVCEDCDMKIDFCKCGDEEHEMYDVRKLGSKNKTINMVDKS